MKCVCGIYLILIIFCTAVDMKGATPKAQKWKTVFEDKVLLLLKSKSKIEIEGIHKDFVGMGVEVFQKWEQVLGKYKESKNHDSMRNSYQKFREYAIPVFLKKDIENLACSQKMEKDLVIFISEVLLLKEKYKLPLIDHVKIIRDPDVDRQIKRYKQFTIKDNYFYNLFIERLEYYQNFKKGLEIVVASYQKSKNPKRRKQFKKCVSDGTIHFEKLEKNLLKNYIVMNKHNKDSQ